MKTKIELIDRERANFYLSSNTINRPIVVKKVEQYCNEMKNGKWKENTGETIKISTNGTLIDGQHRLSAIVKADAKITFLVVYDLEKTIFDVLDTGKPRGATDVFAINNIPNYNVAVSMLRGYISFKNGVNYKASASDLYKVTNQSLLEKYNENAIYYDEVVLKAMRLYSHFNRILQTSTLATFILLFNESNEEKSNQLCEGSFPCNKSIKVLRDFLIRDKISLKKVTPTLKNAFIIKTWNAFLLNKDIKILKFDSNTEKYPTIL